MGDNQYHRSLQLRVGHRRLQLGVIEVMAAFYRRIRPAGLQLSKSDFFFWEGGEGDHCSWIKQLEFEFVLKHSVNPPSPTSERRAR